MREEYSGGGRWRGVDDEALQDAGEDVQDGVKDEAVQQARRQKKRPVPVGDQLRMRPRLAVRASWSR
jgi:hypothetical protein